MVPVSVKLDAQLPFIDLKGPFRLNFWALGHLYFDPGDPGASASTTTLVPSRLSPHFHTSCKTL